MSEALDLYDFPADHIGRKTYVGVRGHNKSIPQYKTYVGSDRRNYLLPEYGGDLSGLGNGTITVLPDKVEYVSPLDGKVVGGRAAHREHMNIHSVYEAGDLKIGDLSRNRENAPLPRMGESIKQAIEQLRSNGYDRSQH